MHLLHLNNNTAHACSRHNCCSRAVSLPVQQAASVQELATHFDFTCPAEIRAAGWLPSQLDLALCSEPAAKTTSAPIIFSVISSSHFPTPTTHIPQRTSGHSGVVFYLLLAIVSTSVHSLSQGASSREAGGRPFYLRTNLLQRTISCIGLLFVQGVPLSFTCLVQGIYGAPHSWQQHRNLLDSIH